VRPLATILTPTYQQTDTLRELAECIFSQTLERWRWWICMDGSTPENEAVARELAEDSRVTLFSHQTTDEERKYSYRPAVIYNRLVPLISTLYYIFISDDDLIELDCLSALAAALDENPHASGAVANSQTILLTGNKWVPQYKRVRSMDVLLVRTSAWVECAAVIPKTHPSSSPSSDRCIGKSLKTIGPFWHVDVELHTHRITLSSNSRKRFLVKCRRRKRRWRRDKKRRQKLERIQRG
jgi:hypothetical protein